MKKVILRFGSLFVASVLVFLNLAVLVSAHAGEDELGNHMYGMMGWPMYSGFGWFWMFICLLFWIGIIWLIVWLINQASGKKEEREERALEILKKRYAKGEITRRQYEQMKKEIGGG